MTQNNGDSAGELLKQFSDDATTLIPAGYRGSVDSFGNIVIEEQ